MKIHFKELKKPWLGKYSGIVIIPFVFLYLKNKTKSQIAILKNHEMIHVAQVNDEIEKCKKIVKIQILANIFGWLTFYAKYIGYWLKNVLTGYFSIKGKSSRQAYMNIPYEKEAYANEKDLKYLEKRVKFAYKEYK